MVRPAVLQLLKELGLVARVDPYNEGGAHHDSLCVCHVLLLWFACELPEGE